MQQVTSPSNRLCWCIINSVFISRNFHNSLSDIFDSFVLKDIHKNFNCTLFLPDFARQVNCVVLYISFCRNNMKTKCSFCNAAYKSKFCLSLHKRLHKESSESTTVFRCSSCEKKFVSLARYKSHINCHGYSRLAWPFTQASDGK